MRQEPRRRGILQRPARRLTAAGGAHPARFHQHVDGAAAHRHAANFLDFGTGDGLVIGDDRQGFDGGARQFAHRLARRAQVMRQIGGGLELPAATAFHQVDAARRVAFGQFAQQRGQIAAFADMRRDIAERHRRGGGKDNRLQRAQQGGPGLINRCVIDHCISDAHSRALTRIGAKAAPCDRLALPSLVSSSAATKVEARTERA